MIHRAALIHRAVLVPLVVGVLTAGLISAVVLQHHESTAVNALASGQVTVQQPPPEPPPPPPSPPPPTPSLTPLPVPTPPPPPPSPPPTTTTTSTPPKPPARKPVQARSAPCVDTVRACVKLSSRQAWLLDGAGNVTLGPVPITSGKRGAATRTGMWTVLWKDKNHKSKEFDDAPMPYSVFFEPGGIAFHSGSLRAQSSGCIHLASSTAIRFYGTLSVGDAVQVVR